MAGMFDDLIPEPAPAPQPMAAGGGMFDDLIPQAAATSAIPGHGSIATGPIGNSADVAAKAMEGIPILGGLVPKAGAAVSALANPLTGVGETGDTFGERYDKNLAVENARSGAMEREHPYVSTAAGLIGGTAATLPLAATGVGAKLLGLTAKTLPGQIAAGAVSGTGIGAADSAVRGEDVTRGSVIGAGTGAIGPVAGRVVGKLFEGARGLMASRPELPTSEAIGDAAEAGYRAVRGSGVEIKPAAIATLAQTTEQAMLADGLRPALAPKTFSVLSEIQNVPAGATASFADLHSLRRVLGSVAASPDPTEKMAATRMISALDGYLENIPAADVLKGDAVGTSNIFRQAQANYAASKRADLVQGKVEAAENQAASANSGANIENATRQRIKDILNSPKLRRGYSPDELLQMQKIVRGTSAGNALRVAGNVLGGGGGLGAVVSGGAAAYAGAGLAAPLIPAAGYAIKKAGAALTRNEVQRLDEMIRARAPASAAAVHAIAAAKAAANARLTSAGNAGSIAARSAIPSFGSLSPDVR